MSQALHHCSIRSAFGAVLNQQPLMRNVLADLVLENEGALALTMRVARALDNRADEHEDLLVRLCTAVGKYWICKRTPNHAYEAMECIGGSGVMEDSPFPRLFRESPVNAIWEGSGNVQCLDVLRAMHKSPEVVDAFFRRSGTGQGRERALERWVAALRDDLGDPADLEYRARGVVDRMALAIQAALLVQHAPAFVADAFCASRLADGGHRNYGTLPARRRLRGDHRARDAPGLTALRDRVEPACRQCRCESRRARTCAAQGRVSGGHVSYGCIVRTTAEVLLLLLPEWSFSREPDSATGFAELVVRPAR